MKLSLQTFSTIVANSAAAVQAASNRLLDLSTGSVFRAILEANASTALWMQWLIVSVLRNTRASSSTGADLDSWMADFAITRLPAASAVGTVTFSRYSVSSTAWIFPGTTTKTSDGSQTFVVASDSSNAAWDGTKSAYVLAVGVSSINVPIIAQSAGAAGNVQAGAITVISSPVPGVDLASNSLATGNGVDAEVDSAFRARFVEYINSRSRSTLLAIESAISSVQQGLCHTVLENVDASGTIRIGSFLVVVDDGSGSPSSSLLAAVNSAVEQVRPIGSVFSVRAPSVTNVRISLHLTLVPGSNRSSIVAVVAQSLTDYVNRLPIGATLPVTKIAQVSYDTDASIVNVTGLLVNGQFSDVAVSQAGVVKVASILVT